MAQGPPSPSSDSDSDAPDNLEEYQYESEGEEALGNSARALFRESGENYRLARAALLAYTRDDLVYVSSSNTRPPYRRSKSHVAVSPGMSPSRTVHPAPQPLGRTQSMPLATSTTGVRFITPPSTPSVPRRSLAPNTTATRSTPDPQPPRDSAVRNEQREPPAHCPTPISGPSRKYHTTLYPLLSQEQMSDRYMMHDGVSKRPPQDVREMLKQIKLDPLWLGDIRYVDTTAIGNTGPKPEICRPSPYANPSRWYTVTVGTTVGIFVSWNDVAPCVTGVSGAVHRAFNNKRAAYDSFQYALILGTVQLVPHS